MPTSIPLSNYLNCIFNSECGFEGCKPIKRVTEIGLRTPAATYHVLIPILGYHFLIFVLKITLKCQNKMCFAVAVVCNCDLLAKLQQNLRLSPHNPSLLQLAGLSGFFLVLDPWMVSPALLCADTLLAIEGGGGREREHGENGSVFSHFVAAT